MLSSVCPWSIGQRVRLKPFGFVLVLAIHPFGAVDVESVVTGKCYRVSGLCWKGGAK